MTHSNQLPARVRSLFLSDLHLGYWISKGQDAIEILDVVSAENVYLVGDIVDETRLKLNWCWPDEYQATLDRILSLLTSEPRVFAVPGNHDLFLRSESPLSDLADEDRLCKILKPMLSFERAESFDYVTVTGKRIFVTHGDLFDTVWQSELGVTKFGARTFDRVNRWLPRSLVIWTRDFFKLFLARPREIEHKIIEFAISKGYDGAIFGHLHEPKLYRKDDFIVGNCGDWVSNQSFLVETLDGQLELYNFKKLVDSLA